MSFLRNLSLLFAEIGACIVQEKLFTSSTPSIKNLYFMRIITDASINDP